MDKYHTVSPVAFAHDVGASPSKRVILLLDNAGWHTLPNLAVPERLRLVYLPPYSPELQPAETLWTLVDEPIVNRHIASIADLEAIVAKRCLHPITRSRPSKPGRPSTGGPNKPKRADQTETV